MGKLRALALGYLWLAASVTLAAQAPGGNVPELASESGGTFNPVAREELNQGIAAYKNAHYDEAISRFERALQIEPGSEVAAKYLGTAWAQQVVPGLDTPDNLNGAGRAITIFRRILDKSPHDADSMKQIAAIDFSIKNFDEAKEWQKRVLNEEPGSAEAAYMVGVIDWTLAHQNVLNVLQSAGLQDDGEGNRAASPALLGEIKAQNFALVTEGLEYLTRAVDNRPDYEEAMIYLNLTYRRKADVDCADESAREEDLAQAKEWTRKAMEQRAAGEQKRKAQAEPAHP